ncbi:protein kinase domain-containing protein [Actinophytocola algeriensis]|uniref:non-specific serine/threonine protein kinase n=1 Tax=Actinophytocola algeriensis TaxID=1768010 RepID=A0A7W7Q1J6_9PSEU|nr:protein kinase [Actinophytocola algeriensis]MBB4905319.1 serine/threonine protein kinase [Actinophytocola algeriensis]MBE1472996.1 serine/threonine protein kinase [Actinophytocola algeriensis]
MEPGEVVAGRYRVVSLVGRGAMGIVWLARDERLDRDVAIKELRPEGTDEGGGDVTKRAMREGRIAARLRHPNAIAVHDVITYGGRPCLVMEYLKSASLAEVTATRGGLPPAQVAAIGAQVAAALAAAHANGVVHRDVKPDNVLLTTDGTAKITDFGVSRAAGLAAVTATGILAGTPAYLAPEIAGGAEADTRSDVYSLGATLYAAIEGTPPFGLEDNAIALLHKVARDPLVPPRRAGPLTDLLLWLLRRDPAERPTMRVAHEALAAAAQGGAVPVPPPRNPTLLLPSSPPRRVSRRNAVVGVTAVALVAAGIALGLVLGDDDTPGAAGSTTTPTTTTTTVPEGCVAAYEITNSWPGGHQVRVVVRNDGERTLTGWQVRWTLPDGEDIGGLWAGRLARDGDDVTVTNESWNVTVPAGGSTEFGFNGSGDDPRVPPVSCQEP